MKKAVKTTAVILTLIFSYTLMSFGQEEVKINRNKRLSFKGESEKAEIKVSSTDEYNFLRLNIHVELVKGEVKVEIIDPEGNPKGNFTVKSEQPETIGKNTVADSHVSGQMSKNFSNPMKGKWIIRANPSSAEGSMSLNILQAFEPRIDMIDPKTIK